jgi:hypothetical protein
MRAECDGLAILIFGLVQDTDTLHFAAPSHWRDGTECTRSTVKLQKNRNHFIDRRLIER